MDQSFLICPFCQIPLKLFEKRYLCTNITIKIKLSYGEICDRSHFIYLPFNENRINIILINLNKIIDINFLDNKISIINLNSDFMVINQINLNIDFYPDFSNMNKFENKIKTLENFS